MTPEEHQDRRTSKKFQGVQMLASAVFTGIAAWIAADNFSVGYWAAFAVFNGLCALTCYPRNLWD